MKTKNKVLLVFCCNVIALFLIAVFSYSGINKLKESMIISDHEREVVEILNQHLIILQQAETWQRGFIITGKESFLENYNIALAQFTPSIVALRKMSTYKSSLKEKQRLDTLQNLSEQKMIFIKKTITVRREKGFEAALKMVSTEKGKTLMEKVRKIITEIQNEKEQSLQKSIKVTNESMQIVLKFIAIGGILSILIVIALMISLTKDAAKRKILQIELENSKNQIQTIFKNAPDAIIIIDATSKIIRWNPKSETLFGWNESEMIGKTLHEYIVPQVYREAHIKRMEYFFTSKDQPIKDITNEVVVINKQGIEFSSELFVAPIKINDTAFYIVFIRDTTEQKKFESDLKKAKEFAEQLTGFKDQFLSNMSHEIRTPLNAVIGFTELLTATKLNRLQADFIESIKTAGQNLLLIVNDILDLSKIESGKLTIDLQPFNLQKTLNGIYKLLNEKVQPDVIFNLFLDANLPEMVLGDQGRLNQILVNLIGNSIKFTKNGQITVSVQKVAENSDEYTIRFSVKDTGIGIAQEKLNTIFERFTQAEDNTTRQFGGTGLGLNIVKQLVELQKSKINVKSQLNLGSEFFFDLIYKKVNIIESSNSVINKHNLGKLQILLCEDNSLNQKLALHVINSFGFDLDIANDGQEGINLVMNKKYDLILMDLQMPVKDGYDTTKFIRNEMNSTIPIIAMTAHSLVGEQERCFKIGMDGYVPKPFKQTDLLNAITNVMQKRNKFLHKFDFTLLNEMSANDETFKQEMIALFIEQVPQEIINLDGAIKMNDFTTVAQIAHKTKSSLEIFNLHDLANLLAIIEESAKLGLINTEMLTNFNSVRNGINDVIKSLKALS